MLSKPFFTSAVNGQVFLEDDNISIIITQCNVFQILLQIVLCDLCGMRFGHHIDMIMAEGEDVIICLKERYHASI